MENHYRELLRFLSARLGDRQAAADVAHDAYLRVLERSSQARIEHPRAFLYRTALLRKLEGLSHNEIAAHLNISRSLVEKHIVNAMRHCRLRMRAWESS